jgi:glutamate carboxypeptidase
LSGDEETGSTESRDVIVEEAKKAKAVLCLEPAPAGKDRGKLKTERLGRSVYKFEIYGKSAHAGNNPQEGVSPIKEIGRLIGMISELENEFEGVTANAVSVKSGTDSIAMIPGYGEMFADIRFDRKETAEEIHKRIMGLKPFDERIRLKVIGGVEKPLMAYNDRLFSLACSIGDELGVEIKRTRVGGGSDGNFTSGAGTPTLDGMGLTGEALHNENERIYIDDIPFRVALLTRMLQEV